MWKIDNFPYPTHIPAKIGVDCKSVMLGSAYRGKVRLIIHEIIFQEFQPSQTAGRTDRQFAMAIQRSA